MRVATSAAVVALVLLVSTACGTERERGTCDEADPAVVKKIMAGARSDFRTTASDVSPGIQIDHLELLASGSDRLPEGSRKFGADRLVAILVSTVLGDGEASDQVEDVVLFAVDADGVLLGPVGTHSSSRFDLKSPDEPGWLAWGEETEDLSLAFDLLVCLSPTNNPEASA